MEFVKTTSLQGQPVLAALSWLLVLAMEPMLAAAVSMALWEYSGAFANY